MISKLPVVVFCMAGLATGAMGQDMTQREIAEHISLWRGFKAEAPIAEGLAGLNVALKKKFGNRQLPVVSHEQVLLGMLNYTREHPESEFVPDLVRSIESGTLPMGSLLHFGSGVAEVHAGNATFEVEELVCILYLGLHLDPSTLSYGGRWRSYEFLKLPLSVKRKQ